jgi:hypothetical protein
LARNPVVEFVEVLPSGLAENDTKRHARTGPCALRPNGAAVRHC